MRFLKTTLPLMLAFATALLGISVYFVSHPWADQVRTEVGVWNKIIGGVTILIGVYSISRLHWGRIRRRQGGWAYSILLCFALLLTVGLGVWNSGHGPFVLRPAKTEDAVSWLYQSIAASGGSTVFSILGFFICSAAYRTFRAKTVEAAVLLVAALVVMLGQVPVASMVSDRIPAFSGWLMDVPNMAVKRAILFGICLGSVATSLRVMFGIERSYLGGD